MEDFIIKHPAISWVIAVTLSTLLSIFVFTQILNLIERKWKKAKSFTHIFRTLRRIIKVSFTIVGLILISYIFFDEKSYDDVSENLGIIVWFGIVAIFTVLAVAINQNYFHNKVAHLSTRDKGDTTLFKYLSYLSTAFIYFIGIILVAGVIPPLRNLAAAVGTGAGVFALVAGVAAQEGIANLIGGLFIAFFKPFRIGDIIKVGDDVVGHVEDLNLRHTVIKNFENKRIIIPNAVINKENIINYHLNDSKICEWIEVGVAYSSNLEHVITVLREVCESHPHCLDNRTEEEKAANKPIVDIQVINLGDSSINLRAWVWCDTYLTGFKMRNHLFKGIKERFEKENIEIPFPHLVTIAH
ncbi:MAG: mechanosensitive ion channel family protein [Aureispira sp.]|nr:mechanosensitive ion channel family protein [Aureispira sp.]